MRRTNTRRAVALMLALCIGILTGCGQTVSEETSAENTTAGQTITEELPAEGQTSNAYAVDTLKLEGGTDWGLSNPFQHVSRGPGTAKMRLVYGSLMEKDENGDVPWLAESWSIDGNAYTFTLYEGLQFHDGQPLTTEDVAFSLDYYKQYPPVSNSLGAGDSYLVERYEIVDERTITLYTSNVTADTLSSLGSFVILPKHVWESVEDPYTYDGEGYTTGSGAYMLTAYDGPTGSYEFTAFTEFVPGKPAAQRILFVPVSDSLLAFENGEIDITAMPADLKDKYLSDPNIGIVDKANDSGTKLLINFEKCPEFLDRELRVALYHAINRQQIVDNVFRGAGSVGSAGYVPEGSLYYNEDCTQYEYDPEAAKSVLGDKGLSVVLTIDEGIADMAQLVKLDLEAAGMQVEVVAYDSATRDDKVNAGDYEFAMVGNGGWGNNPPTYMRTIFSDLSKNKGGNPHSMGPIGYSNAELTELCEAQMQETDFEARIDLFKQIQKIVSDEVPLIVLGNQSSYSMYRKDYYDGWMKTYAYQQAEQNRLSYMIRS